MTSTNTMEVVIWSTNNRKRSSRVESGSAAIILQLDDVLVEHRECEAFREWESAGRGCPDRRRPCGRSG